MTNNTYTPPDLGSYTLPDGTVKTETLTPNLVEAYDGVKGSVGLDFSQESGGGSTHDWGNTFDKSNDYSVSAKVSFEFLGNGGSIEGNASYSRDSGTSESHVRTTDNSTSQGTGITLSKTAGNSNHFYRFAPVFYFAKDGAIKVSHAVDIPSATESAWWHTTYGQLPDPGLNLPKRFYYDATPPDPCSTWKPETSDDRKKLRGFFLESATPNPVTGSYDPLPAAPKAGDKVRMEARVYNFSVGQQASNVQVAFSAAPYDTNTAQESGPRVPLCGSGGLPACPTVALNPLENKLVPLTWDTSSFGPKSGAVAAYRIIVDLKYDGEEIHPPEKAGAVDPGQNNEGYAYAYVCAAACSDQQPSGVTAGQGTGARLGGNAISVASGQGQLQSAAGGTPQVQLGQESPVRVMVTGGHPSASLGDVLIYDGDPNQGGTLLADERAPTGDPSGNGVWLDWVPTTAGVHHLYAQLVDGVPQPAALGATLSSLDVEVTDGAPQEGHGHGSPPGQQGVGSAPETPSGGITRTAPVVATGGATGSAPVTPDGGAIGAAQSTGAAPSSAPGQSASVSTSPPTAHGGPVITTDTSPDTRTSLTLGGAPTGLGSAGAARACGTRADGPWTGPRTGGRRCRTPGQPDGLPATDAADPPAASTSSTPCGP